MSGKQKVLVTGGTGFIGSHTVVALYEAGFWPVVIDNFVNSKPFVLDRLKELTEGSFSFHEVDCTDSGALRMVFESEGDLLGAIHFAAFKAVGESVENPIKYYQNNIGSLVALLQQLVAFGVKHHVFSSSCTVYGEPDTLPVTEESPIKPAESPYGYTKQVCERLIWDMVNAKLPIRHAILRYFNPIGAHPSGRIGELPLGRPSNLIPFVTQTAAGWREELTINGNDYPTSDGTCVRDYIHVVDTAEAHVAALEWLEKQQSSSMAEVFNIGTGQGNTVTEVVETFEKATGIALPRVYGPRRPGDVVQVYANTDKAKKTLNWNTRLDLADALRDAWRWQQTLDDQ